MDIATTDLLSKIIEAITQKTLTLNSGYDIITVSMELINQVKMPGGFKADIVTNVLKLIVGDRKSDFESLISQNVFNDIELLIDNNLVKPTIDVIYSSSSGNFNIGEMKTCITSWLSCLTSRNLKL